MTCWLKKIRCFVWPKGQSSSNVCENIMYHCRFHERKQVVSSTFLYTGSLLVPKFTVEKFPKCTISFGCRLRDIRRTNSIVMPILYLLTCLSSWRIIHPFALPFLSSLHVFWHSFYGNFITLTLFFRNLSVYKAWDCDSVGVRLSWLSVAQLHALVLICYISP